MKQEAQKPIVMEDSKKATYGMYIAASAGALLCGIPVYLLFDEYQPGFTITIVCMLVFFNSLLAEVYEKNHVARVYALILLLPAAVATLMLGLYKLGGLLGLWSSLFVVITIVCFIAKWLE